jgi:alpha-tubulin suppressor-like RCC1 family protein
VTPQHRVVLGGVIGLLIAPEGTVQVWMANYVHADGYDAVDVMGLGHNRPVDAFTLYRIPGLANVVTAAASSNAGYVVLADGQVMSWGAGGYGLLGTTPVAEFETQAQPRTRSNTPQPVAVRFHAVDVSARGEHVLSLARDGSVYAWGRGDAGQLGIGALPTVTFKTRSARVENFVPYPVRIPGLADVAAISAGTMHSLALLKDGTVRAWGQNRFGQVGDGTVANRDTPTTVSGVRNAVAIAATGYFSVALLSDGTVMEWGATYGNPGPRPTPARVAGASGIRSIAVGDEHVVALTRAGTVMTWGQDAHYQTGRSGDGRVPGLVKELSNVQAIAASGRGSAAVLASGRIMIWSEVRPWNRPGDARPSNLSRFPILLWVDGLEQP